LHDAGKVALYGMYFDSDKDVVKLLIRTQLGVLTGYAFNRGELAL